MLPLAAGALLALFAVVGPVNAIGEPTLSTDKADYAPGETVHVTGVGFAPGDYALPVKRPDGSIVKGDGSFAPGWDTVTVGITRLLSYDYKLNGIEGTYEVRAYPATWRGDWSETPIARTTFTDAARITARNHEGQRKILGIPDGYTNGNVTTYSEGDPINFRFTLEANEASTGLLTVRYTENDGTCLFFDGSFSFGTWDGSAPAIEPISGATPTVVIVSGPTPVGSGTSGAEWVVTLSVSFSAAGSARLNYFLRLSDEAGQCNGASQHSRLQPAGGDVAQTGAQNVPVPANQVVERPDITASKVIDRNGDGTFESTAAAGEYCFRLDGGPCVPTNSLGQVVFENVTPDGPHTVTEEQIDFSQGTYAFDSGTGTNCVFVGSTATATVSSGTTPVNASCTFRNKQTDKQPSITVQKTASPTSVAEPGGAVTYTVTVTNTSPEPEAVTLLSLVDNRYGNLDKDDTGTHTWTTSTCDTGGTIAIGGSYTCTFTAQVTGSAGTHTNTVTATVADDDGNEATASGSATVTITDVAPTITVEKTAAPGTRPEPGGSFTFSVEVTNTSLEPVTLTALTDDVYGNLDKDDLLLHSWTSSTCDTGGEILPGASYTCSFVGNYTGNAGDMQTDTVTATVRDDEGTAGTAQGSATVALTDVAPTVEVTKDASPKSVPESGGMVTFTITATNTSFEPVTLTALTDDRFGDLNGRGTCTTGGVIAPGATYSCTFGVFLAGEPSSAHTNTVTATVQDDDGSTGTGDDSATVSFTDLAPTVTVTKDASPQTVPESGGTVTFTITATNTSFEPVTLTALDDDRFGDLNGRGTCAVPQTLAPGETYTCSFSVFLSGQPSSPHTNTATATVEDDDGSTGTGSDSATVTFIDVAPTVAVTKDADPQTAPESGGTVTFTVTATNTSFEPVTLTTLDDDRFGDLNGQGTCAVPQTLASGATYSCSFSASISGRPASPHTNTVTATVEDDDGSTGTGSDSATVVFTDVLPTVEVTKSPSPQSVPESGGQVTFTITATNTSFEAVTLTTLTDDRFGNLDRDDLALHAWTTSTCDTGGQIEPGETYTCTFTATLSGEPSTPHQNTTTAVVTDDDGSIGSGSGSATVTFTDIPPTVVVTKEADKTTVPESGDAVTFTITLENTSFEPVTVTDLTDDRFGDLSLHGTCATAEGTVLAPGATYSCSFSVLLSGEPGSPHTNTATATVEDNDGSTGTGSDSATVTFTDVPPTVVVTKDAAPESVPESGGPVTFTVSAENTSFEPVTLTALSDDRFGNLNGKGTCATGGTIAPGATYSCTFTVFLSGEPASAHTNTVTATVEDNEGSTGTGSDSATVTFTDVLPTVEVTKTAEPQSVPESGGTVTFTVSAKNTSFEPVTLELLLDDRFGNLNGKGSCATGGTIAPGATYSCSFSASLSGEPAAPHTNTVTATVRDNDNSTGTGSDSATVTFTDVAPTITLDKTASPTSVNEPGGNVTFGIAVTNTSFEAVTLTSLDDDKFGNLFLRGTCTTGIGATIAPGATFSCSFDALVTGNGNTTHTNTATATVRDNDLTEASASDTATVTIEDVQPTIEVTKTAAPSTIFEPAATVTFTVTVRNTGVETITLISLTDDKFGDLNGKGTCTTPQTLAPGATYSCSFTALITGAGGTTHTNTVTATVTDDEGNRVSASATATVTIVALAGGTAKMTGGGQIVPSDGKTASFGLIAQFKNGVSSGHFNYVNHTTDLHINGPVTLIYNVNPLTHTLSFRGTSSRNGCTFDVTVTDNDEPGTRAPDRFTLTTSCVAPNQATTAPLTKGNLQWHPTQG